MTHAFDLSVRQPGFRLDARAAWDAPFAALFGASGSGKTTIVEAIAGARPDVAGSVVLGGRRVDGIPARERAVGWAPQDASLFPHMTAAANVAFGARRNSAAALDPAILDALEIAPVMDRRARDLSGGERQRVAIARALASSPAFLLLDEPLASVDLPLRSRLIPLLAGIPARCGIPVLLVTHDPLEVLALAAHVMVLEAGRVVAEGPPRDVFASAASLGPVHALGAENVFAVTCHAGGDPAPGVLTAVTGGGCALVLAAPPGFPAPTRVAIRSEDIMLATERPRGISAQNVLEATIERIEPLGDHVHVAARASGELFRAKVTERARVALGLNPGSRVHLLIKAHAIHPCA
jgi:molybdate transport system ATP-binding protein